MSGHTAGLRPAEPRTWGTPDNTDRPRACSKRTAVMTMRRIRACTAAPAVNGGTDSLGGG